MAHGIPAASLQVVQNDEANTAASVTVTTGVSVNDFRIRAGSNRGDYNVQIGEAFSDDVESGVLIACVAENGRDNGEVSRPGMNYCTAAIDYSRTGANAGAYWIPVFQAPAGAEYNINVAAAFFAYTNWLGGFARNSGATNGGLNDLFTGSPGLVPGTHFLDHGGGRSTVNLTSLGVDSRTDGVLLVTGGKNEDNYALSHVNNNGTWTVFVKDNGSDGGSYEQDPVGFVFVPRTNTMVISGRFRGDGGLLMYSGATPRFSVSHIGVGRWRLSIPGHSAGSGVLIVSAEGGLTQNRDNIVSCQADGQGWIIESRDLPGSPPPLETPGLEPVASFVFIPAAATTALISPADLSRESGTAPMLQVSVSNAAPGRMTVEFHGRLAGHNDSPDFTIAVLPDTQYYSATKNGARPAMWYAQTEWIITNRVSRNIVYVTHLGDIVENGDLIGGNPNLTQWRVATNAMYRLEDPARTQLLDGIPYGLAVGNHDQEPIGNPSGTTLYFNQYFGVTRFSGRPYYGGHYGANNNNHFDLFSAGGMDFIVLYLEYDRDANPAVLAWANDVLRDNAHRRAIVVTHHAGSARTPSSFSAQGAATYHALKTNANFFLMLGGHVNGEGSRVDTFNGNTVRTLISDYQFRPNGGNGWMRTMTFSPGNNLVIVETFSPWTNEHETDEDSEFWFHHNMQHPVGGDSVPFSLIGTVTNVSSGDAPGLAWPGRAHNTAYEWQVRVSDEFNHTTISPVWRFVTAANLPPVVSNTLLTIVGDAPTNLTLVATDPNGDPLTFQIHAHATRGLLEDFDSVTGAVTYRPAHGYRGADRFTFSASDGQAGSSIATMNLNVAAPPDTNGNGLPDTWETTYGVTDPNADDDGDGMTNLEEYLANTNPANAASRLRVAGATRAANGHVTLTWPSVGGTRYRVQFSNGGAEGIAGAIFTDIVRPVNVEMDTAPHGAESTQTFVDDFTQTGGSPGNAARYYRIKVAP